MKYAIDLIILLVPLITIIIYAKKGLVRSIFKVGGTILSFVSAWYFAPKVVDYMIEIGLYESIMKAVAEKTDLLVLQTTNTICNVIAFVAVFLATKIVMMILAGILDKVCKLPVLKSINTIGGLILGIVAGVINFFIVSSLIGMVLDFGIIEDGAAIVEETVIYKFISDIDFFAIVLDMIKTRRA